MKKTLKQVQKEQSKERILNVSSRLFRTQGFATTGIDQIMADSGLTAGAFYSHFRSKEDLFEQSLQHALHHARIMLTKDTEALSGEAKTNAILKRYCSTLHRDFPEKGCILPSLAAEVYRGTNISKAIIEDYIQSWSKLIVENLGDNLTKAEKTEKSLQLICRSVGAILLSRMVGANSLSESLLSSSQKI